MADKDKNTEGISDLNKYISDLQKSDMDDASRKRYTIDSILIFTVLGGILGYNTDGLSGAFLGAAGLGIFGLGAAKAGMFLIDTVTEIAVRKADAENVAAKLGTKPSESSEPPENVI